MLKLLTPLLLRYFYLAQQHQAEEGEGEVEGARGGAAEEYMAETGTAEDVTETVAENMAAGMSPSHSMTPSFGTADNFSITG